MKTKLKQFLAGIFLALIAVLTARAEPMTQWQREQDASLVRQERELSRLRRENPNDAEIARRHDQASRAALQRARERVGLIRVSATAGSMPLIGYVASTGGPTFEAFRQGMRDAGYVEGRDFVVEARFTEGRQERFPALVDELLRAGVDVLLAGSPTGAIAALKADTTTPIVIAGALEIAIPEELMRRADKVID